MELKVMYVNKLNFVVSTSQGISSVTEEYIKNIYKSTIMASIKKIVNLYSKCVFKVTTLILDPYFKPIHYGIDNLKRPPLNMTSAK